MTDPAQPVEATPRTKRAIMDTLWEGTSVYELVRADFTRQLERELAVANRQLQLAQTENAGHIRIEDELKAELREALARCASDMVPVPREPTRAMLNALNKWAQCEGHIEEGYRAMLNAVEEEGVKR